MNMKSRVAVVLGLVVAVVVAGCNTPRQQVTQPQVTQPQVVQRQSTPRQQATPRDRAAAICKALWEQVSSLLVKHDFATARKVALERPDAEKSESEIADMILLYRIGLLTSVINPFELEWRIGELDRLITSLCDKGEFEKAYELLNKEEAYWRDAKFTGSDEALEDIRKELAAIFYSETEARKYSDTYRIKIDELINGREGPLVQRSGVNKAIDHLAELLKSEMPQGQKELVDKLIASMKEELNRRNLTTSDIERLMSEFRETKRDGVRIGKGKKNVVAVAVKLISVIRARTATLQALASGIDFNDEIDMMEVAARTNSFGRGLLFAECAYGLRTMLSTNFTSRLDYQNLLSASLLLRRMDLMEIAVKSGADVTKPAPDDVKKSIPVLLAVEDGNKAVIAWFCDKGAHKQLVQNSSVALAIAVRKNRLDLFKYLRNIGCPMGQVDLQRMFSICCAAGADNFHEYLFSIGATPSKQDFAEAVRADNLIMVKWFVETLLFNVNKDLPAGTNSGRKVMEYLCSRGMQLRGT